MKLFFGTLGRILSWLVVHLPVRVQYALGDALGLLWFDILRVRRQVVINNMGIAFPQMSRAERVKLGRRAMCEFGRNLIEYCRIPFFPRDNWRDDFVFIGLENLREAQARGKGVLLLSMHLGNGDLAMAGLALLGLPIRTISKEFKTKWLNDLWFGMRMRLGAGFIPPRNSAYAVLKGLKKQEVMIFVHDQFTGPPIGIKTTFFGRETGTGLGLAMMAERSGAPVLPAYAVRNTKGQCEVHFEPEIPFVSEPDREQALAKMTQVYTDHIEKYVRLYPEQWMWLHKRWKVFKY